MHAPVTAAGPSATLSLAEAAEAAQMHPRWLRYALANGWIARDGGSRSQPRFDAANVGALSRRIRFERQYERQRQAAHRRYRAAG